jgi:NADH-quinone oxidoreductase subunit F
MLKAKDRIFTNLFGDQSYSLGEAQSRGDWDQTSSFIKKGSDWIIDEVKNLSSVDEVEQAFPQV